MTPSLPETSLYEHCIHFLLLSYRTTTDSATEPNTDIFYSSGGQESQTRQQGCAFLPEAPRRKHAFALPSC